MIRRGDISQLRFMLSKFDGGSVMDVVNVSDEHGTTPLMAAVMKGHRDMTIYLIKHGT